MQRPPSSSCPAAADASAGSKTATLAKTGPTPSVSTARPMKIPIGATLTIRGHNFLAGKNENTVVFQRTGGEGGPREGPHRHQEAAQGHPSRPAREFLRVMSGVGVRTRFCIRILSALFGKRFTTSSRSPIIRAKGSSAPPAASPGAGDCDGDGAKNVTDPDDDNDLLGDATETPVPAGSMPGRHRRRRGRRRLRVPLGSRPQRRRAPGAQPVPALSGKRPYPNPLDGGGAGTDFDATS